MTKEKAGDAIAYILGFKPVKTARHRLLVIVSHILLWGLFLTLPLFIYRITILNVSFLYRELINKSFLIGLFYFNYYYLLPRFFQKRRLVNYFLSILAAMVLVCVQQLLAEVYFLQNARRFSQGMVVSWQPGGGILKQRLNKAEAGMHTFTVPVPGELKDRFILLNGDEQPMGIATEGIPLPPKPVKFF